MIGDKENSTRGNARSLIYVMTNKKRHARGGDPENEWISRKFIQEVTNLWGFSTMKLGLNFGLLSFECLCVNSWNKSMDRCKIPFLVLLLWHGWLTWRSLRIPYFYSILELTDAFDSRKGCSQHGLGDGGWRCCRKEAHFASWPFHGCFFPG